MSSISEVLSQINNGFEDNPNFEGVPIYWDEIELSPNSTAFPCLLLKLREWRPSNSCSAQRILEVWIMSNTQYPRDILLELWDYEESVREVMDAVNLSKSGFDLKELGGSEVLAMRPNKANAESYKGAKDLWSNLLIIYYNLQY